MVSKKHILDEIRRTAAENGGVPLGRKSFENETSIKPYDWQKYWARWSEAIGAAGFQPNRRTPAYAEGFMLEALISLARELDRLPTVGDMRVKRTNDDTFPSYQRFYKRFGSRVELIQSLLEYCKVNPGHEDIVQLCDAALLQQAQQPSAEKISDDFEHGYVYLLKSGRYYKIGKTNSAGRRERELAIQLPERASTVHAIKTDDPAGIERYWHQRFQDKRKHGEWFELSAADVSAFKRRKFM